MLLGVLKGKEAKPGTVRHPFSRGLYWTLFGPYGCDAGAAQNGLSSLIAYLEGLSHARTPPNQIQVLMGKDRARGTSGLLASTLSTFYERSITDEAP
jgi:hypothetical protein